MDTSIRPIIGGPDRRRHQRLALSFKQHLVALTLVLGASVARLAREHGVNANQVFTWRACTGVVSSPWDTIPAKMKRAA